MNEFRVSIQDYASTHNFRNPLKLKIYFLKGKVLHKSENQKCLSVNLRNLSRNDFRLSIHMDLSIFAYQFLLLRCEHYSYKHATPYHKF